MQLDTKKNIKSENLKHFIGFSILAGFLFGIGKGLLFISSHRYFELELYKIAFSSFRSTLNYFTLIFPIVALILSISAFFFYSTLTTFLKDSIKAKRLTSYVVITLSLIGLYVISGYGLNKSEWYPAFFSVKGVSLNILVTLFFISSSFLIFKKFDIFITFFSYLLKSSFKFSFITVLLLLIVNLLFYYNQPQANKNGVNVLLITVDTLRADHLGSYGYVRDTSPAIDNLADEGILFSQSIVQWPKTSPSFASIMTSTYGYYNGVRNKTRQKIGKYYVLLAEMLKNAHYNTVGIVTNGNLSSAYNFNQGFNEYIEVWKKFKSEDAEHVSQYALSWLKDNANKGNFFMWLHYADPHAFYEPSEPYNEMYVGDKFYNDSKRVQINADTKKDVGGIPGRSRLGNHDEIDYYIAQYDAEIRYMDENIRKVLDELQDRGIDDTTIVIFTSDHGESLGEHNYFFEHGRLPYDACSRVPLIIKVPGLKSGIKTIDHPVELINIMPTIFDILDIQSNNEVQGKSLLPAMLGNSNSIPEYTFTEAGYMRNYQRVIRTKDWKLIYIPDKEDQLLMHGMPFELYDIKNDPDELNNVINVETKIADQLKKELFKWMKSAKSTDGLPAPDASKEVTLDKETTESLKALGYLE